MRSVPAAVMRAAFDTIGTSLLISLGILGTVPGCSRHTLALVDMDLRRVPDVEPLVERITLTQAYWSERDGGLAVAAGRGPASPSGSRRQRVDLSFVLVGLPAERSRDYLLNTDSLRAYVRQGPAHRRFRSTSGIVAVWLEPSGNLRVKFRVLARRETFHILTGWSAAGETLLLGEFFARPDNGRAAAIMHRSEADGMTRSGQARQSVDPRPRPVQVTGPPLEQPTKPSPVREEGLER